MTSRIDEYTSGQCTLGRIHVGASGKCSLRDEYTSGRMLLASLALSGLRPSAFGLSQVGFEITNKLWAHVRLFTGMLLLHIIEIQFSYMILDTYNGKARHAPVTINTKCNDLLRNTYGKLNFYWEVK